MLNCIQIHPSWNNFLTKDIKQELGKIHSEIGTNYNPTDSSKILRFLELDLYKVAVIWLGQDVYPAKGVATGRAFEVGGLTSWQEPFRQSSLKNIVRCIYKVENHLSKSEEPPLFSEIRKEIALGTFPILEPPEWFHSLEQQGVLFLNTSFTCEIGEPNSHKKYWKNFSNAVLKYIRDHRKDMIYFLWGKEAQNYKTLIQEGVFYKSRHPARVSPSYPDDFLKFTGFEETKQLIKWIGQ